MLDQPQIVDTVSDLSEHIASLQEKMGAGKRLLIGLAGAPGSGKSTLADVLVKQIPDAIAVPMDGYHLDNVIIEPRGDRPVKGAPHTFDVDGLISMIQRLKDETYPPVYIPVFDRSMDLAKNAASLVDASHKVVVVEGNYLLLKHPGWQRLHALFDLTVMLDVPMDILQQRLVQRWIDLGRQPAQALKQASGNDLPNARTVVQDSIEPHIRYRSVRQ